MTGVERHIRPSWDDVRLSEIKPLEVRDWLKGLKLKPRSKNSIKNFLHLLFDRAMLMGLLDVERNPMELVKVKGGSKRDKEPAVLSPEEFQTLMAELKEPHSVMVTVAMCTGLSLPV